MKVSYYIRASASFLFGMLFALFVISVNHEKTYMIVLPSIMGLLPSMVLGSLMCSMLSGEAYLIKKVFLSLRLFSIIFICISIFIFGFLAEIFFTDSIYAIIFSALFGLFLGYTFADWHVLLYRATYNKTLITVSAIIFIFGQYFSIGLYSILSVMLDAQQAYPVSIVICLICSVLLVLLTYLDGVVKTERNEYVAPVLNDFLLTQLQLLLLILIAAQAIVLLAVVEYCFQENLNENQWVQNFSDIESIWSTVISVVTFLFISVYVLRRYGKIYLVYTAEIISCLVFVLFVINIVLEYRYEYLLYLCVFLSQGAAILLFIIFNSLVIDFFKSGTIRIFVPITTAIMLFFLSLYQSVVPVVVTLSVTENSISSAFTLSAVLILFVIFSGRMSIKLMK
ncbi:hypothetical protein OAO18_02790 [Francisellaceae bacterium]|nr:hypothetical protein [Francisellaceae bacterium]